MDVHIDTLCIHPCTGQRVGGPSAPSHRLKSFFKFRGKRVHSWPLRPVRFIAICQRHANRQLLRNLRRGALHHASCMAISQQHISGVVTWRWSALVAPLSRPRFLQRGDVSQRRLHRLRSLGRAAPRRFACLACHTSSARQITEVSSKTEQHATAATCMLHAFTGAKRGTTGAAGVRSMAASFSWGQVSKEGGN